MREEAVHFGDGQALSGVLTRPSGVVSLAGAPVVILLNSGLLHRIGPYRGYVALARELAAQGITTLRFDLSGIGESLPRKDGLAYPRSAVKDVQDAMDHLVALGFAGGFVLAGICSGADNALAAAVEDDRVRGLVLIEGLAFPTLRHFLNRVRGRLRRRHAVVRSAANGLILRMLVDKLNSWARTVRGRGGDAMVLRHIPSRAVVRRQLEGLVRRGVMFHCIYSGDAPHRYSYADQLEAAFPVLTRATRFRVDFFPEADHLFTGVRFQSGLRSVIVETLCSQLDATPATTSQPGAQLREHAPRHHAATHRRSRCRSSRHIRPG